MGNGLSTIIVDKHKIKYDEGLFFEWHILGIRKSWQERL